MSTDDKETGENFADYPETMGERRSDKSQYASDWSPRDALIYLLREIDRGNCKIEGLVVCYLQEFEDGAKRTRFVNASPNLSTSLGMLSRVSYMINVCDN